MNAALLIYLAGVSADVKGLMLIGSVSIFTLMAIAIPFLLEYWSKHGMKFCFLLGTAVTMAFMFVLIPDKQTIYLMAAGKVAQDIVESPQTKEIGNKILKAINSKLDEASK